MSQLTKNTTDLDALIAKANALPDAGTSEDLTAVLDAQETLISELEAELEGKAAGGGGVETCTVNIQFSDGAKLILYSYTHLDSNGKITTSYIDLGTGSTATLQLDKVVCNSLLYITWSARDPYAYADYSTPLDENFSYWKVCSINGAIDTIYCIDAD